MGKKFKTAFLILIFLIILVFIINIIFYNPSITKKENAQQEKIDELQSKVMNIEDEFKNHKDENNRLNKELSNLQDSLIRNKELVEEQVKIINNKDNWRFKQNNLIFPIYTANWFDGNREILFYTSLPKDFSLEEQLNTIAYKLSQYCFEGLPIDLVEIKEIGNKKVAVVNLKELDNSEGKLWTTSYFQGSFGGSVTSTQLIETFLQKEYWGKWINGVEFLYENNKIEFEHTPNLNDINYRK